MNEGKPPPRPAEYGEATPQDVGKAVLRHRPKGEERDALKKEEERP